MPLELSAVGPVDPASALVPVRGRAVVTGEMRCGPIASDLGPEVSLRAFDVYPVASYTQELASPGEHVLVLGAGHAGLLAVAAARRAVGPAGMITAVDVDSDALERAREVDPGVVTIRADVTDPLEVTDPMDVAADLTLVCTSVPGASCTGSRS